jgi:hypothetical protein
MRANGMTHFKDGDLEITLSEQVIEKPKAKPEETDPALLKDDPGAGMPSDSDLLFWSTPSFDTIVETRKEDEPRN